MSKRIVDIVFSCVGLLVLFPFLILAASIIKLYDGGPVFFVHQRVGRGGRIFGMLKFRTMVVDLENAGAPLTIGKDRRITRPGAFLRAYKIDELPQLLNVLWGTMSLVGPRPEIPRFVAMYSESQRRVLELKPGITDPASFAFFDESELLGRVADPERFYREQLMGEKIRINLDYAAKANLMTDLMLMFATVGRLVGVEFDVFRRLNIALPHIKTREGQ